MDHPHRRHCYALWWYLETASADVVLVVVVVVGTAPVSKDCLEVVTMLLVDSVGMVD
jgi:hypothetical protein